jgi:drug/metabolite transporter (DMT)-like permease
VVNCTPIFCPSRRTAIGRTFILTLGALVAFASNSLLCRLALGGHRIDAGAFTAIRLASGAVVLALLAWPEHIRQRNSALPAAHVMRAGWRSGFLLFAYAIAFSLAYVTLTAATGALVLFTAVQATIVIGAIVGGERPRVAEWCGLALATTGLAYLTLPGLSAPPLAGCALMFLAGVAWGLYTLRGRGSPAPLGDTARNFMCTLPLVAVTALAMRTRMHVSAAGIAYAVLSGALASGLGYVAWYAALRRLTAARAATAQLAVPVIAALGAALFLSEHLDARFVVSAALILGGIALALLNRTR